MPSVDVLATSAVATKVGWRAADALRGVNSLLVLDRFGALIEAPVLVRATEASDRECFLGSRAAFGSFAGDSLILESNGTMSRMSGLVDGGDVRERRFEATLASAARCFDRVSSEGVWRALESIAAVEANGELAIRCVEFSAHSPQGIRSVTRSGLRYLVVSHAGLSERFAVDWSATVLELGRALFRREEDNCLEIPTCAAMFGLWYATAYSSTGRGFRFAYDSIQHSSYLFVHDDDDPSASAGALAGLSAFRRPSHAGVVALSWSDPTWNPLVNGFIVSGT